MSAFNLLHSSHVFSLRHCRILKAKQQKILFSLMAKGILPPNWKRETRPLLLKMEAKNLTFNSKEYEKY